MINSDHHWLEAMTWSLTGVVAKKMKIVGSSLDERAKGESERIAAEGTGFQHR